MSLEEALKENTAALLRVVANQEKLIAGQAAAIEKIEGAKGAGKKADAAAAKTTPAASPAKTEPAKPAAKVVSKEDVKASAVTWMTAAAKGKSEADAKAAKAECGVFLGSILTHFGLDGTLAGPDSKLDAEQFKQAKFFIERKAAGLKVDFSADYDFDGDPKQGGTAAPAAETEEDPLG